MKTKLTTSVTIRVSTAMRRELVRKARREAGLGQSEMIRALIYAYVENRIKISYRPQHKEN